MAKIDDARKFLQEIGMPDAQTADLCCLTILAMAGIKKRSAWNTATNMWVRIHDIIRFVNEHYGVTYAENSREIFRKQALHHFRTAALIEDNGKATNSPNYRYRLTAEALDVLKSLKSTTGKQAITRFKGSHKSLVEIYASKKRMKLFPVQINSAAFYF